MSLNVYNAYLNGIAQKPVEYWRELMQETVNVEQDDDAKTLSKRVLEVEHRILKESIRLFCENKLSIQGRRVFINE